MSTLHFIFAIYFALEIKKLSPAVQQHKLASHQQYLQGLFGKDLPKSHDIVVEATKKIFQVEESN